MDNSTSVDTLVYQLEDDDASVRWDTIQRLRKRAAVERAQLPVRNPRRFLHCLRRRLGDEDPRIARETLLLLTDVIDVLHDDVEQILASILPHLIPRLPRDYRRDATESDRDDGQSDGHSVELASLHEETFHVFRKYVNTTNDLAGVVNVLVNMGIAHARASVREAALLAIVRLLDERYGRRNGAAVVAAGGSRKSGAARVDTTLFTDLVQAIVPTLEDADERVVVAAEEAIAKIQLYWGASGFQEVMQFLSAEDKATLKTHDRHIQEFVNAASAIGSGVSGAASVTASQVLKMRASLPVAPTVVTTLRFGFVPADIIDALNGNTGNSNAEWKKRTAAVEQLYACAKHVDRRLVRTAANADAVEPMVELVDVLFRLLQDIDVHLVKRSLQIQRLIFYKLEIGEDDGDEGDIVDARILIERLMPGLVETAANYAEDEDIKTHVYTLLQTVFSGRLVSTAVLSNALLGSFVHRRLQIREEAAKIWMVLLLTAQAQSISTKGVVNDKAINALGRALGDGSSRVRLIALELAAVLASVTRQDLCAIIEDHLDDFTLERIDLDALYGRLRSPKLPVLLENGQLKLTSLQKADGKTAGDDQAKAQPTRSPVQASKPQERRHEASENDHADGFLDVRSELQEVPPVPNPIRQSTVRPRQEADDAQRPDWGSSKSSDLSRRDTADQIRSAHASHHSAAQREIASAPGEPMVDKLQALKRKTELLKKSASSKQVANPDRYFNPQEGDFDFASAGYAAQQPPPAAQSRPNHKKLRATVTKTKQEDEHIGHEMPTTNKAFQTPRDEQIDESDEPRHRRGLLRTPPSRPDAKQSIPVLQVMHEDRPIRPRKQAADEFDEDVVNPEPFEEVKAKPRVAPISLATKKRLEAKQKLEQQPANTDAESEREDPEPSPEAPSPATRPISLATRKRLEAKSKIDSDGHEDGEKVPKRSSIPGGPGLGKQEPRYLETHELTPVKDPKQEAAKAIKQLHLDDWEANFDALTTVRRLAAHHPKTLQDQIHSFVTEILKHVPNLRSSVAKNALLALDSMCSMLGKLMDGEVDNIIPVLMKRCLDSNTFVCESASSSINAVILNCSTSRVVYSIAANLSSRAIPIRREVARAMHTVIVSLSDQIHSCKELGSIFNVIGKCLEDSNNEVRDAAKQSILYLNTEQGMNADKLKKMLPSGVHSKVDSLLTTRRAFPAATTRLEKTASAAQDAKPVKVERETVVKQTEKVAMPNSSKQPSAIGANRRGSILDTDELANLIKKLENVNWRDRFDALDEAADFCHKYSSGLCESGKITVLFDSILKRMEDGNAKVSTQAMELLPAMISSLGNAMELVLSSFVPAVAKGLAVSNPKQSSLAHTAIQALCSSVDVRLLCQHFSAVARHANVRVKPAIIEILDQLASTGDDRNQSALTRYVLPLSLDLLKEAKSEVKDVNARLIRTLYQSLGQSMFHSSNKLSTAQQERLAAILGTSVVM